MRWKGYDESHDQWKKESDITKAALDEYREHLEQAALSTNDEQEMDDGWNSPQDPEKQIHQRWFAHGCEEGPKTRT